MSTLVATERFAERLVDLPVDKSKHVIYRLEIPDVNIDRIVDVTAQFEVTNKNGYNCMVGHYLLADGEHIPPAWPATENVTPDVHHGFRVLAGRTLTKRCGSMIIELVIYAGASRAQPGDTIRVEQGYGGLSAIVHNSSGNET